MQEVIVIGHGILGLFSAVLASLDKRSHVIHYRAKGEMASVSNQGWLQSGVMGYLWNVPSNHVRDILRSHDAVLRIHGKPFGPDRSRDGFLLASPTERAKLAQYFSTPELKHLDFFHDEPIEIDPHAGNLPFLKQHSQMFPVYDRPFPDSGFLMNALATFLENRSNVEVKDGSPLNMSGVEGLASNGAKVLLCIGTKLPGLLGWDKMIELGLVDTTKASKNLKLEETLLLASHDVPVIPDLLIDPEENYSVARHRRKGKSILIWSRQFGLPLDFMSLDRIATRVEGYEEKCKLLRELVKGYAGVNGIIKEQICKRIEYESPMQPFCMEVLPNVFAGLPGKATSAFGTALAMREKAGLSRHSSKKVNKCLDRISERHLQCILDGTAMQQYRTWFHDLLD